MHLSELTVSLRQRSHKNDSESDAARLMISAGFADEMRSQFSGILVKKLDNHSTVTRCDNEVAAGTSKVPTCRLQRKRTGKYTGKYTKCINKD